MPQSYLEAAHLLNLGQNSKYHAIIDDLFPNKPLTDEQQAIMALILERVSVTFTTSNIVDYVNRVIDLQKLMPSGTIRSRQMLVLIASQVGLI